MTTFRELWIQREPELRKALKDHEDELEALLDGTWVPEPEPVTGEWTRGLPTEPGIYLRNNPPSGRIVRHIIVEVRGRLCTARGEEKLTRIDQWSGAETFWWYGPIPEIPTEEA